MTKRLCLAVLVAATAWTTAATEPPVVPAAPISAEGKVVDGVVYSYVKDGTRYY